MTRRPYPPAGYHNKLEPFRHDLAEEEIFVCQ